MPILAVAITTIICDGHAGTPCPSGAAIEYDRPRSVAVRLAKQSGWTVWIETLCPDCVRTEIASEIPPLDSHAAALPAAQTAPAQVRSAAPPVQCVSELVMAGAFA